VKNQLKLGVPKGSLQNATIALFKRSGWNINVNGRSYFPEIDDDTLECAICRAQEMSNYVESGTLDVGLTGKDWIAENESDIHVVTDLVYSKVSSRPARWVLAVPFDSPIKKIEDCEGKKISTEMTNFTRRYFKERNINVSVEFSWGATEAKVVSGLADAIVEVTETESTIKAHGLRVIHELMQTNTQLIANHNAWKDAEKRAKIEQIAKNGGHQNECARRKDGRRDRHAAEPECTHSSTALSHQMVLGGNRGQFRRGTRFDSGTAEARRGRDHRIPPE
jgi:ATP phosphoribosyltransferase